VAAIVEPRKGFDAPSLEEIQDLCRKHVAGYKIPRELHVVDQVERAPSGKPDYRWAADVIDRSREPG
jgi:acyl-CoA synthetase (AMP-forming)/AMP-acid ligase II